MNLKLPMNILLVMKTRPNNSIYKKFFLKYDTQTSYSSLKILVSVFSIMYMVSAPYAISQSGNVINEGMFQIENGTMVSSNSDFTNEAMGTLNNDGELILRANLLNFGTIGFKPDFESVTRFEGFSEQILSGDQSINLKNVVFANIQEGTRFLLENDLNIYGIADFTRGILDNTNFLGNLTFFESAESINASNKSFVSGPVNKIGTGDFVYPIGKDRFYRSVKLGNISTTDSKYEITYFLDNSNDIYSHDLKDPEIKEVSDSEYWTLEQPSPNGDDVLLTFSYNKETTPNFIFENEEKGNIAIARWDQTRNTWVNEGGVIDINAQTITTGVNKTGFFTLARISNPEVECIVTVYNAVTPNDDGVNDFFRIDAPVDCVTDMNVTIFNRLGVKVFETDRYGPTGDLFDGFSSGRLTVNQNSRLPTGTYYYLLNYQLVEDLTAIKKVGYLYLNGN